MMYMAFPLHGGLVESCHTAAENTNPAFGLFTRQKKKKKKKKRERSFEICFLLHFSQHLYSAAVMVFIPFRLQKKEEQNFSL